VNPAHRLKSALPAGLRKRAKFARYRIFDLLGSSRYAMPSLFDVVSHIDEFLPVGAGTYLEIGANDGYSQSTTFYLERVRGWSGILIEPDPANFLRCVRNRPGSTCFQLACVDEDHANAIIELTPLDLTSVTGSIVDPNDTERSRRHNGNTSIAVLGVTLSFVIDASPFENVDFMSIDVEGAELSLLKGLDLSRHAPSILIIETHDIDGVANLLAPTMKLERKLTRHDYLFLKS
jgi:FkbM family methyltransferase